MDMMPRQPQSLRTAGVLLAVLLHVRTVTARAELETPAASGWAAGYETKGAIEVDTNENTLFLWHDEMYVLENIPCYYSGHASHWDRAYNNASYTRIRRFADGAIVVNISSSIGFGFLSAFVDQDLDTVWLFGSACNRCPGGKPGSAHALRTTGQGCAEVRKVQAWSNRLSKASLQQWATTEVGGTFETYNVEVSRVRSSPAQQTAAGLPPHRYVMIMEIEPNLFAVNNNADGDLTHGWTPIPGVNNDVGMNGGPSIRWNPLDQLYYAIVGGRVVELIRTKDFKTWERSPNRPFIKPGSHDGRVAPYAGFAKVAAQHGFTPMGNTSRWDWNSNDADVCCMEGALNRSYVIWGAGTQGRTPEPPLTRANHCANVVGVANVSLPQLLADHFKPHTHT